jgi:hypothetical protein
MSPIVTCGETASTSDEGGAFRSERLRHAGRTCAALSYDVSDRLRLTLGGNLYRGPRTAQYGVLRPGTGMFAEFRYGL